jgi:aspartate/methionine/tyrosine aminotransferase
VFDEIYALSTFAHLLPCADHKENPFISVMSLTNLKDLVDPAYVHVLYGLSKDFNINGYRVGFIIDQYNPPLRKALGGKK